MKRKILTSVGLILIFSIIITFIACTNYNEHTYTVKVNDKERVQYDKENKYLIYCKNKGGETIVLENTDNWLRGKVNSSDFYAELEIGETYNVTVIGFRFPVCNYYENVISYEQK